jgi:hypothetical protein
MEVRLEAPPPDDAPVAAHSNQERSSQAGQARVASRSVTPVVLSIGALAALVWAISPGRFRLSPAPLKPPPPACTPASREFIPSNFTGLADPAVDQLPDRLKYPVLYRLNTMACRCGCRQSVASCRFNFRQCRTSSLQEENTMAEVKRSQQPSVLQ